MIQKILLYASRTLWASIFLLGSIAGHAQDPSPAPEQVLVFTKTNGYRHSAIEAGVKAIKKLGEKHRFEVTQTEDALSFHPDNLKKYQLVLFLNTTENVLDEKEQKAFEDYISKGGNYMGIHAAADTEYEWPWYNKLVGAYFESHPNDPNVKEAVVSLVNKNHPATAHLKSKWTRTDEWYNYKNIQPHIKVLLNLEESSYQGGTNGANHPIAWYHETLGGRAFYTGGGHTEESYNDPLFLQHLWGGIAYCLRR
jgi:type 1 glutamine amidotransferase